MFKTILLIIICSFPSICQADALIYIPPDTRQHNQGGSCGFASITNCLRSQGLWDKADQWWENYRGPINTYNAKARLDKSGLKYKMIYNCDEKAIIDALESGRMVAVTWGGNHMVNIVGKIGNKAYLVDNNRPREYVIQSWDKFLRMHRAGGGWGVIILSGHPAKPVEQKNLKGYEKSYKSSE